VYYVVEVLLEKIRSGGKTQNRATTTRPQLKGKIGVYEPNNIMLISSFLGFENYISCYEAHKHTTITHPAVPTVSPCCARREKMAKSDVSLECCAQYVYYVAEVLLKKSRSGGKTQSTATTSRPSAKAKSVFISRITLC
jgi:hypothetical protein